MEAGGGAAQGNGHSGGAGRRLAPVRHARWRWGEGEEEEEMREEDDDNGDRGLWARPRRAERSTHPVARAHGGRVVRLVDGGPLLEGDVVGVDHHRVGDRERLAVHDHAERRLEQREPLLGDEAHARVLGDPRLALVELGDDRLRLGVLRDGEAVGLGAVEAVGDPLRHLVPAGDGRVDAGDQAALVERDDVAALPKLEGIVRVEEELVGLAAIGAHHHREVGHDRRAGVVHA